MKLKSVEAVVMETNGAEEAVDGEAPKNHGGTEGAAEEGIVAGNKC